MKAPLHLSCTILFLIFAYILLGANGYAEVIDISQELNGSSVSFQKNILEVSTGKVKRTWRWTGSGFQTQSFLHIGSGKEWCGKDHVYKSDWDLPERIDNATKATLISVECVDTNDESFTSDHLLLTALVRYEIGLEIKFLVRVYPNAPGIWTALEVRSTDGFSPEGIPVDIATYKSYGSNQPVKIARNEFIPVDFSQENQRRYWGIYNNPGNRVNTTDMVKEKVVKGYPIFQDEQNTWASGLVVEAEKNGLIILKESNKTVNKYGHQTGSFYCTPNGVEVTGWGLKPGEISNEYKRTWPTWTILYSGNEDDMQLAFKQFDRIRYPVNLETDMHILIDTWGSDWQNDEYDKIYGRENSVFSVVEKEIISASDLGIDIVRIDDGWQEGSTMSVGSWHPNTMVGYDEHWTKTVELSKAYNVGIGLWAAIRFITPEEMMKNQRELNVKTWKFDFDKLEDHDAFAERMKGIREFIKQTNYTTQTSWCPEYDDQRYGWYSAARECGPMYFQNIQNNLPNHLAYVPYITLRHHWMMSKFYNMNDLQCHWQNPSRTNPKLSDAYQHSQAYAAMSSFMAAPSCFMLTQLLKPEERNELRKIISTYKEHRKEIFEGFVFPIGDEPNNASWTGFQIHHPEKNIGFLMIFRELHNDEEATDIKLKFVQNDQLKITNLENGSTRMVRQNEKGVRFAIENPATYHFLKYEVSD